MLQSVKAAVARLRELVTRGQVESERDDEFRFHLEMQEAYNRRHGMSPDEARRAALLSFGGVQRFREETRDARGVVAIDDVLRDARFAVRRLRRSPGFSVGVIVTLGVGIGAAVAIGTLVYRILLQPLPYAQPHELMRIGLTTPRLVTTGDRHSEATYAFFRDQNRSFSGVGAYFTNDAINLTDGADPRRITAALVTPSLLQVLRVTPAAGRLFSAEDAKASAVIPVMISHDLWIERYGGSPSLIGSTIEVNRSARRVVGVLPAGFDFPVARTKIWYPLSGEGDPPSLSNRYLNVVGRLRAGVTEEAAQAELRASLPRLSEQFPTLTREEIERSSATVNVISLKEHVIAPVRGHLRLLGIMVIVVLTIALANVANLFLLRTERLRPEIAISRALGAGRGALARRFIIEGLVIGVGAIIVALPLARMAVGSRFGFSDRDIPRLHELFFGWQPAGLLAVGALLLGAAVGLFAFMRTAAANFEGSLRVTARTVTSAAWQRLQQGLVAGQMALALTLILGASLMGRSLWNLRQVDMGFEAQNGMSFEVALPFRGYGTYGEAAAFHESLLTRLRALPGTRGAEAAMQLPLTGDVAPGPALRLHASESGGELRGAAVNMATPNYFRLMGIPLLHGRTFASGDLRADPPAIVVSAALARALFGDEDPIGRVVRRGNATSMPAFRVVGVVGNVHGPVIEAGVATTAYFPLLPNGDGVPGDSVRVPITPRWIQYVIRSDLPLEKQASAIRAAVREIDPLIPVTNLNSLPALVDAATARVRLTALLLAVAATTALLLGVIGVYSIVSYAVTGRRREFGVRIALGASPTRIGGMVLREGAMLAAVGTSAGLLATLGGARFARSMLYEVSPTEPAIYVLGTLVLLGVATAATLLPARKAANVNPVDVLRGE